MDGQYRKGGGCVSTDWWSGEAGGQSSRADLAIQAECNGGLAVGALDGLEDDWLVVEIHGSIDQTNNNLANIANCPATKRETPSRPFSPLECCEKKGQSGRGDKYVEPSPAGIKRPVGSNNRTKLSSPGLLRKMFSNW
ncbi:hypothetical protein PGT21_006910 [Puccinia graminis f. sp. tritici]|uniref:Uncharacterized protein n=1 Tax=Puccinia graminis f. sp. tritici TaxID=56615 RepID=A0A5B0QW85_PUCGR|nr:hypothetical protein PGT21_006910 [Puccinia graminis f. sp. tritici]